MTGLPVYRAIKNGVVVYESEADVVQIKVGKETLTRIKHDRVWVAAIAAYEAA